MLDRTPKVFISYSWTSKEYQESIISLSERMRHDGVDIKLDVWDLKDGQDKYAYMEQCVTDDSIDKVLILSDHLYAEKADKRKGGGGNETKIISVEVYEDADQQKFIPVVMERDEKGEACLPQYLKSRIYRDLSGDNYEAEYELLLRTIYEMPSHKKPELGERPLWLSEDTPDAIYPLKGAVKKITVADLDTNGIPIREFLDIYIESMKQFYDCNIDEEKYLKYFSDMKEYRNVFLDHLKAFSDIDDFGVTMADQFERLYNSLYNIETFKPGSSSCGYCEFDLFQLHIWELFVCTITYMLHYEMYEDINKMLVHTYFLRTNPLGSEVKPFSYEMLRFYSKMLEERIKPKLKGDMGRKFTLTGHYVVNEREYKPIYSAKAMAMADLFLYQIYNGLELDKLTEWGAWFPTLYVYADQYDSMWKKLTSKRFCEKIMPVFGVNTLQELKERVGKCAPDKGYHYSGAWAGGASAILSWVKLDDVATLP